MIGLSLTQATYEAEDRRQWREYTRLNCIAMTPEEDDY